VTEAQQETIETPAGALVALVTGANKGIGLETVRRLARAGYLLYLTARNPGLGQPAADTAGASFLQMDVTSDDSVRYAAEVVERTDGHLDVLVNNAGITGPLRDVHDYTADDIATILMTNVVGYVRVIHAFLPLLERSQDPRIVNAGSGLGSFALFHDESRTESSAGTPLYGAAKAAINMLTARYAKLLPGIRINVADPGMTATDLSGGQGHSVSDGTDAIIAYALAAPGARPEPTATATTTFPGNPPSSPNPMTPR
jgi:NAD(P)-dependent dehydrogenase (short-subunit alcohol dehydrogenase family)